MMNSLAPILDMARTLGHFITPCLCAICQNNVDSPGLCPSCWKELFLITNHSCQQCGLPFEYKTPLNRCGDCLKSPPAFDETIAAAKYDGVIRDLIISLKHGDRHDIAPILAKIMYPRARTLLQEADIILPLPLHKKRFFMRRFNQSAELARYLINLSQLNADKMKTDILLRHKNTTPQGHKTRHQRKKSLQGAFHVPDASKGDITGKHIVIIDDVMTTGASVASAARTLKRAGAKRVSAVVAARVC